MSEEEVMTAASGADGGAAAGETEESWRAHVVYARDFRGTNAEYCRRNRLDPSVFRSYKKKFGRAERSRSQPRAFVRVQSEAPASSELSTPRQSLLPDPQWTAEFVAALLAASR